MLKDRNITKPCSRRPYLSVYSLMTAAVMLALTPSAAWADIHLKLISGKRAVKDKLSFTIEVDREKIENPRNAKAPDFIKFLTNFAEPASGVILLDGKGVLRFDGTNQAISGDIEITYGRHEVTMQVTSPAVVTLLDVSVRGGVVSEVIAAAAGAPAGASAGASAEDRITALEQKVKRLEAEIEALKRERRKQ
ncbi:MAG TPA: hypothetical protein VJ810_40655 [Blastocatellia bacterium]|nr:hypothetical protein [Blastocatellia bacterium]